MTKVTHYLTALKILQNLSTGNLCLFAKIQLCCYKYGLLTKCEVKMAGYWASSIFVCLWTETKSRSIDSQKKKERGQYPAILTEQTWSIKDLLYGFRGNFSCGIQRVVPSGQDGAPEQARWLHLARSGSQSHHAIWFILPARRASHIITSYYQTIF